MEPKYVHHEVGFNSRLNALQAAVLRVKLRHLDFWTLARRIVAKRYDQLFEDRESAEIVQTPIERSGNFHVFNQYVIRVPAGTRDDLKTYLTARRIGTEVYYPIPLHLQTCFSSLGHIFGDFPVAEDSALRTLALPMYPELSEESQGRVVDAIAAFYRGAS